MIVYLDMSALVPLLINEPSSAACAVVWNAADDVASNHIAYVECAAALAAARRAERITSTTHRQSLELLDALWSELIILPVDEELVIEAATLAAGHSLRGYDAIHCASALRVSGPDLLAATSDRRLLAAWNGLGVDGFDVNQ